MENIFDAIKKFKIPQCWLLKSYPSVKPIGSYINDLIDRINWFRNCFDIGVPTLVWISAFFNPRTFINAQLQMYSRRHSIPIIHLMYDVHVLDYDG